MGHAYLSKNEDREIGEGVVVVDERPHVAWVAEVEAVRRVEHDEPREMNNPSLFETPLVVYPLGVRSRSDQKRSLQANIYRLSYILRFKYMFLSNY